jgi:hypothetical protein
VHGHEEVGERHANATPTIAIVAPILPEPASRRMKARDDMSITILSVAMIAPIDPRY